MIPDFVGFLSTSRDTVSKHHLPRFVGFVATEQKPAENCAAGEFSFLSILSLAMRIVQFDFPPDRTT